MSVLVFNGSNYGDAGQRIGVVGGSELLDSIAIRVVLENVTHDFSANTGYIGYSQADSANASREFGLFNLDNGLQLFLAGLSRIILTAAEINAEFGGSAIPNVGLQIDLTLSTGSDWDYTIRRVGAATPFKTGTDTFGSSAGTEATARLGVRGDGAGVSFFCPAGSQIGNQQLWTDINDTNGLVQRHNWVIPAAGSTSATIQDTIAGIDFTMTGNVGDGSDYIEVGGVGAPVISEPVYSVDPTTQRTTYTFSGSYADITPTQIQYRVMQGATEIISLTDVNSFSAGTYSFTPSLPIGVGYHFEIVVSTSSDTFNAQTDPVANPLRAGIGIALIGSSTAERFANNGASTVNGFVAVKSGTTDGGSWTGYDNVSMPGSAAVTFANALRTAVINGFPSVAECPICFYDYGVGGTRLTIQWNPDGSGQNYNEFIAALNDSNNHVSFVIPTMGRNDAALDNTTVTQSDVEGLISALRVATGNSSLKIIWGASQRSNALPERDAAFTSLWTAEKLAIDADSNALHVSRVDLELDPDNIHNVSSAMDQYALRASKAAEQFLGIGDFFGDPTIQSVVMFNATTMRITLNKNNAVYTSLTPVSGFQDGFRVIDGSGEINVTAASVFNDVTIDLTLEREPSGNTTLEAFGFGQNVWGTLNSSHPVTNSVVPFAIGQQLTPFSVPLLDLMPNQFDLGADVTAAAPGIYQTSSFSISGTEPGQNLTVTPTSGEVSVNGGSFTGSATTAQNGDTVQFRILASTVQAASVIGTLNINGVSDSRTITTRTSSLKGRFVTADENKNIIPLINIPVEYVVLDDSDKSLVSSGVATTDASGNFDIGTPDLVESQTYWVTFFRPDNQRGNAIKVSPTS